LALADGGVCKRKEASRGTEKQQNCERLSASGFVAFWAEASCSAPCAEGLAPKQLRREPENRRYAGRRKTGEARLPQKKQCRAVTKKNLSAQDRNVTRRAK
jgi:hypothetical protein